MDSLFFDTRPPIIYTNKTIGGERNCGVAKLGDNEQTLGQIGETERERDDEDWWSFLHTRKLKVQNEGGNFFDWIQSFQNSGIGTNFWIINWRFFTVSEIQSFYLQGHILLRLVFKKYFFKDHLGWVRNREYNYFSLLSPLDCVLFTKKPTT